LREIAPNPKSKSNLAQISWGKVCKNGLANVGRGSTAALVAIGVAPFLTRKMSPESYGAWALILQLSAYTGYFDFGVQTAVGRFVAHATECADDRHRDEIASTSMLMLVMSMAISIIMVIIIAWQWPHLFHKIPSYIDQQARMALVLVGCSLAIGLPVSVFSGIFIGFQRNEIPALVIGVSRIIAACLLVLIVWGGGNLIMMGAALGLVNLGSYVVQYGIYRKIASSIRLSSSLISRNAVLELLDYCSSLTIWSFATLLVTGLDTVLVGIFDFHSLPYYVVAATLITFVLGLQNALFGALIPEAAILDARKGTPELGQMLVSATRYGLFLLLASGVPLIIMTRSILSIWVGANYAEHTTIILRVLVVANIIRLSAVPYARLLIGTGEQRLVKISPLVEGSSNLLVSVVAGTFMGALGVAIGTLVGSVIGILCNFVYNMPRTQKIIVDRWVYFKDGLLRPLVCSVPLLLAFGVAISANLASLLRIQLFVAAMALTLIIWWTVGLIEAERSRLLFVVGIAFRRGQKQIS
jgi:O-antigen/teichoic acid export membrane protein